MSPYKKLCSYLLRICVFQMGVYKNGPVTRWIIRYLKKHFDLSDKKVSLDSKVLEKYIRILEELGGLRSTVVPEDGLAQIDYMVLTFENVKKKIEEKGGRWLEIEVEPQTTASFYKAADPSFANPHYVHAFLMEKSTPDWNEFYHNILNRLSWDRAIIEFPEGTKEAVVVHYAKEKPLKRKKGCFLRCHSPGRSYGMDQKYIGKHLSLQKDVCIFNYRGTHKSTGKATEGGYYLDAEAVFSLLTTQFSYRPEDIWVTGFCLGAAVAAHLKEKYHHLGVNYVGENTFTCLADVIAHQVWPARAMGKTAIDSIQAKEPEITSKVRQDLFNTLKKFDNLKMGKVPSITVIINTDADVILPKESGLKLFLSAKNSGDAFQITHTSHKKQNPHADEVFEEERVWNEYANILS